VSHTNSSWSQPSRFAKVLTSPCFLGLLDHTCGVSRDHFLAHSYLQTMAELELGTNTTYAGTRPRANVGKHTYPASASIRPSASRVMMMRNRSRQMEGSPCSVRNRICYSGALHAATSVRTVRLNHPCSHKPRGNLKSLNSTTLVGYFSSC
jgi:hypothetical protein